MLTLDNELLKDALDSTRLELEEQLAALRSEHAEVMGEVGGLKSRNEDLTTDVASLTKRLASELRRAEEAEAGPEPDVARQVIGCHAIQLNKRGFSMLWMTWRAIHAWP